MWGFQLSSFHRRRMETEAKAKVVSSVWGADFIQFLAALTIFPRSIWKNRRISTFSSKSTERKTASAARNCINSAPQTETTTFAFASVCILLLWLYVCIMGRNYKTLVYCSTNVVSKIQANEWKRKFVEEKKIYINCQKFL